MKVFFFLKEFIAIFAPIKGMRALDASHDASDNNKNKIMNTIKKIVLTGGPCAGKTTALVK